MALLAGWWRLGCLLAALGRGCWSDEQWQAAWVSPRIVETSLRWAGDAGQMSSGRLRMRCRAVVKEGLTHEAAVAALRRPDRIRECSTSAGVVAHHHHQRVIAQTLVWPQAAPSLERPWTSQTVESTSTVISVTCGAAPTDHARQLRSFMRIGLMRQRETGPLP